MKIVYPEYPSMNQVIENRKKELQDRMKAQMAEWDEKYPKAANGTRNKIWWSIIRAHMGEIETLNEYRWGDPANLGVDDPYYYDYDS